MFDIDGLYSVIDGFAPFSLSEELIHKGDYDNSGILIRSHAEVKKILFSLDLSVRSVKKAKSLGCDTVVTHHPAIYHPVKNLDMNSPVTAPVLLAARYGMNVISAHLNLDVAACGIDYELMRALGGEKYKTIDSLDGKNGYGKEFSVKAVSLSEYVKNLKKTFSTSKIIAYNGGQKVSKVASFCGGGAGYAEGYFIKGLTDADTLVTSDMPHHIIKELTDMGKNIIILPHYVAEEYGFNKFYGYAKEKLSGKAETEYFADGKLR